MGEQAPLLRCLQPDRALISRDDLDVGAVYGDGSLTSPVGIRELDAKNTTGRSVSCCTASWASVEFKQHYDMIIVNVGTKHVRWILLCVPCCGQPTSKQSEVLQRAALSMNDLVRVCLKSSVAKDNLKLDLKSKGFMAALL